MLLAFVAIACLWILMFSLLWGGSVIVVLVFAGCLCLLVL